MKMDKNKKLNELQERRDVLLKKHGSLSFPTKNEIENYVQNNKAELAELKTIQQEIIALKLQLMAPKEREEFLEEQKKISEKHSED